MSVTCGGGHRSWSFYMDQSAERQVSFLYVKDKQVHEYRRTVNSIINTSIKVSRDFWCEIFFQFNFLFILSLEVIPGRLVQLN